MTIVVNHASCVGEGGWTSQRAQPNVLPLKSVLVPGANRQTPLGWEALPGLRVDCRTYFLRNNLLNGKCTVDGSQAVHKSPPDLPSLSDLFW